MYPNQQKETVQPMKFDLTVNSQLNDWFKLSVKTYTDEQLKVCKELTEKLIEKITKIEVTVQNEEY